MSCSLGTAKMPIVLDHPEPDSNPGSQDNFSIMDLVNKSGLNNQAEDGSYSSISVDGCYKNIPLAVNEIIDNSRNKDESSEINSENSKGSSCKYLNIFHTNDKVNHFSSVNSLNFNTERSKECETSEIINKKYKKKLKSKSNSDFHPVVTNSMQMNLVENENITRQIFSMKSLKPKTNKNKKWSKAKDKVNNIKKNYKPVAPYPTIPEEQKFMLIQKPAQRLVNCNVNANVNPILIVKIEDEQLRLHDDKANKLLDYTSDYQNVKKAENNYIQNSLLSDFENFSKSKGLNFKSKKKFLTKVKCYKCFGCSFTALSKDSLDYHLQKKEKCFDNNEAFHCPSCKNIFYSLTPLKVHLIHDHKMIQKDVKTILENMDEVTFEHDENSQQKFSCAYETNEMVVNGNVFSPTNMNNMEIPLQERLQESCSNNKRQTILESYLDDINSKGNCNLPPPLTQNGSDLLENTFNFTAPVSEQLPSIQPPPAHSSSNSLDQSHLMDSSGNHGFIGMPNVFSDNRDQGQYKGNESNHYPNEPNLMLGNSNYLSSQVHDIPVINLDENNLEKSSGNILPHDIGIDDFSSYQDNDPGPLDEEDEDCRLSVEDEDQEEKKKLKKLGVGYRCDINGCKVRLQSEKNIQYHRRCHEGTLYNCPQCCKDCSTWVSLSSHLWQAHKIDMELYKCDQCPYKTPSYSRLTNIHRGIHGKARPYLCDICGKGFKTVKQMRNHKNIHKAKMVRMSVCYCEICGRSVADKRQLELHINNTHKKKKPYLCCMCGYASAVKHSLIVHMRRHTGEKPYKCEKCDYKTADHNALRRHKMKHSGVRNYKCNHCSYTCIQASTYKVHIKTKHPGLETDIIFSCGQCSFQTLNRGSFLSHTSEHENYNGEIRKQARSHHSKQEADPAQEYYGDSNRIDLVGPIISERVVETIVDLSGAQSLLEDNYYEVERITGDLEEAQELKFKTAAIT